MAASIFKALALCAAQDTARGSLTTIHKETVEEGAIFVATDGHLIGISHLRGADLNKFYGEISTETGLDKEFLENTKTLNIIPSNKIRNQLSAKFFIYDDVYPSWRKVMPKKFENVFDPAKIPFFSIHIHVRVKKVADMSGFKNYSGHPIGWNSAISLTKMFSFAGLDLYAMPCHVVDRGIPAFDLDIPEEIK